MQSNEAHRLLCFALRAYGLVPFETEYRFATEIDREWRWDIAYPEQRLAIEVDGGIWSKGAHGHPITILRNMDKRNWGARLGWRILSFPADEIKGGMPALFIQAVLNNQPPTPGESHATSVARTPRARSRRRDPSKLPPA